MNLLKDLKERYITVGKEDGRIYTAMEKTGGGIFDQSKILFDNMDKLREYYQFMNKLEKEYNREYDFVYSSASIGSYVAGYGEALNYFDNHMTEFELDLLKGFNIYRGDFITSDREAVAFIFALSSIYDL